MAYKKKRKAADSIWELEGGGYLVDLSHPDNKDKRVRKKHRTLGEAKNHKTWVLSSWADDPEWIPKKSNKDNRRLSELVHLWYDSSGQFLEDGERRKNKLINLSSILGNPIARTINKSIFTDYRVKRLSQVSVKTVNNEHGYFCSLFNKLIELGKWEAENPIDGLSKLKYSQPELAYLDESEVERLLKELYMLDDEVGLIAEVCLSTGARWTEAQSLKRRQVKNNTVHFVKTKTYKNRMVGIDNSLYQRLISRGNDYLFRQTRCDKVFRLAVANVGIDLPDGQMTHVLRHTFATHFLANYQAADGLLRLQQILGHSNIKTTEKYLHIISARQSNTETLNPVAAIRDKSKPVLSVVS